MCDCKIESQRNYSLVQEIQYGLDHARVPYIDICPVWSIQRCPPVDSLSVEEDMGCSCLVYQSTAASE